MQPLSSSSPCADHALPSAIDRQVNAGLHFLSQAPSPAPPMLLQLVLEGTVTSIQALRGAAVVAGAMLIPPGRDWDKEGR